MNARLQDGPGRGDLQERATFLPGGSSEGCAAGQGRLSPQAPEAIHLSLLREDSWNSYPRTTP